MNESIVPAILFTAIPSFFAGFTVGGYVVRRYCIMNRWRRTHSSSATNAANGSWVKTATIRTASITSVAKNVRRRGTKNTKKTKNRRAKNESIQRI